MNDRIKKQVEWLINDLLSRASQSTLISVVYDDDKGEEARVYLNGERIATISEKASCFRWPLTDEQMAGLYKACIGDGE